MTKLIIFCLTAADNLPWS